jgi:hypothetical protein
MDHRSIRAAVVAFSVGLVAFAANDALASTFVINNLDGAGEGFNDPTPVSPVGGNTGTTRGAQRMIVLQTAANIWAQLLASNVTISVNATFDPLPCTSTDAVLGSAGAKGFFQNFTGAPLANRMYAVALANSLKGSDIDPATADIGAQFNSSLGGTNCFTGSPFYLGLDGNEGAAVDLLAVVLHEFAHGLGFISTADPSTGANQLAGIGAFESDMLDIGTGKHFDIMTNAERVTSAQHTDRVVWDGPLATAAVPQTLVLGTPLLMVTSPPSIQGEYLVGPANFGPALSGHPASGNLKLVQDSVAPTTDGCETITNVSGAIALMDRGNCTFNAKVKNAQNAGALAALVIDNVAGSPPEGLTISGSDNTITIPSAMITMSDGATFKIALGSGPVLVNFSVDATRYLGADAQHRALLFTPSPVQGGSSLSHWDSSATPDLLMEPIIEPDLNHTVDLTLPVLRDLGWRAQGTASVPALPARWPWLLGVVLVLPGLRVLRRRSA